MSFSEVVQLDCSVFLAYHGEASIITILVAECMAKLCLPAVCYLALNFKASI